MSDQYSVLGSAPTKEDLQKLSPDNIHVQIMVCVGMIYVEKPLQDSLKMD